MERWLCMMYTMLGSEEVAELLVEKFALVLTILTLSPSLLLIPCISYYRPFIV